ncbi:MAG: cupin domain-containing protein [Acidobacteria bacterium]|nr:cupin domain-containing protein [Acidobacteriota bacterium]
MTVDQRNLFQPLPEHGPDESFEDLLSGGSFRLERIVSRGHRSPEGFWYDQKQAEWVLLLQGSATLEIEGEGHPRKLVPGDFVLLPAHCRHRVAATDPEVPTVWLAIHYQPSSA